MSLMIDVDGVLANFPLGFTRLAAQVLHRPVEEIDVTNQPTWDFPNVMTKAEESTMWQYIRKNPQFWTNLDPIIDNKTSLRIRMLGFNKAIYFVTSRPGNTIQRITQEWLYRVLGITYPTVITCKKKGELARVLGVTHAIDDKLENAWCTHWISDSPQTKSFILDRPYNNNSKEFGSQKLIRVYSVDEFLNIVEHDWNMKTLEPKPPWSVNPR